MTMPRSRRNKPLSVKVTRDGVLTIEIGIDTLAFTSLCSDYAYECADPERTGSCRDPREVFKVIDARGFAGEVKSALLEEAEDGSSILTRTFDAAERKAIEDGSQFWMGKDETP